MNNKIKLFLFTLCAALELSSCSTVEDTSTVDINYPAYSPNDTSQLYLQDTFNETNYKYTNPTVSKKGVVVPESYYIGERRSPVSFHDQDEAWINSQNPEAYTIELAEGDKASAVAEVLYKAPKKDRMAQVKSERNGKEYYRGVYGTFSNAAEAQKALDELPSDMKEKALIKNWGSLQP